MEYSSVLKRNELLSDERTWRNLKCIQLSERSIFEMATYCMIPTIWHYGKCKTEWKAQISHIPTVPKHLQSPPLLAPLAHLLQPTVTHHYHSKSIAYIRDNSCYCTFYGGGLVSKSCLTLVTPWTVTLQASCVQGILQASILEWVAISFSRGSFPPKNWTLVSCIAGRFFTNWATRESLYILWVLTNV